MLTAIVILLSFQVFFSLCILAGVTGTRVEVQKLRGFNPLQIPNEPPYDRGR
jgi:hypothetical protein